mgnify:FL=1|tara:strand:+ start:468 stop:842 length:375 start_codon:yes stop_codon:yes gene_type:complete
MVVNKMSKTLQKDSKYARADTNGDSVLSDAELDAELSREQKRIRMDNADKKADQIRVLIWFQSIATVAFVAILTFPEFVPESRLDHLVSVSTTFIIAQLGIIGSYIAGNTIEKVKENGNGTRDH